MSHAKIQVFYPVTRGRIVLRTEFDWNRTVEPSYVSDDRTTFEFVVETEQKYFYFKPGLEGGDEGLVLSQGDNYLATTRDSTIRRCYPHFFSEKRGTFSEVFGVPEGQAEANHRVRIYFPPGYEENTLKRYPVLYMQDGTNLFFGDESFGGNEWRVDENLELLHSMNLIDKVIVVGVYAKDRMNEYTKPGYEQYGQFMVNELKPLIDARLRTLTDPQNTAVMGSSLGGVVSFYLGWEYPDVFGKAACLSSTFGYRDDLMERVASEPKRNVRFYIDSGWPEDNYENTTAMRDQLIASGCEFGRDVLYFAFPGALHNEDSWATRSHVPFQFFFGKAARFEDTRR
jgi:predicted alpha/beta superfamily hydrolase